MTGLIGKNKKEHEDDLQQKMLEGNIYTNIHCPENPYIMKLEMLRKHLEKLG